MFEGAPDILPTNLQNPGITPGQAENLPPPTFTSYNSFVDYFDSNNITLRNQLRYIIKYRNRLKDYGDSQKLLDRFKKTTKALIEEVQFMGPLQGDEAVAGIDYRYYEGCPKYKKDDIVIKTELFTENGASILFPQIEFDTFKSMRPLDDDQLQAMTTHLHAMAEAEYILEEDLPKWLFFFGFTKAYNGGDPITQKLPFRGNLRSLTFWIRALYGVMKYKVDHSKILPSGTYTLAPVIKTASGAGVTYSEKKDRPTTRDSYAEVVAKSVSLPLGRNENYQPNSITTAKDPPLDEIYQLIKILEPLGCKKEKD